jgi:class 3 adenylate cyclase
VALRSVAATPPAPRLEYSVEPASAKNEGAVSVPLAAAGDMHLNVRVKKAPAAPRPGAPRFRVGINTGVAVVGNVGAEEQRSFSAIGDATNAAARLQTLAEPGTVVVSAATAAALGDTATLRPLGSQQLKGRREPVDAFVLEAMSAPYRLL